MEASKRAITPTPFQRIEELTRENSRPRAEATRLQHLESANAYFRAEMKETQAVFEWKRVHKDIDKDFENDSHHNVETGSIKVGMKLPK
jgi:hypothetical protein